MNKLNIICQEEELEEDWDLDEEEENLGEGEEELEEDWDLDEEEVEEEEEIE
ncbi:MAG: hypothetical protein QXR03_02175 [Candidatus Aenigmatarchaeota archaeon]